MKTFRYAESGKSFEIKVNGILVLKFMTCLKTPLQGMLNETTILKSKLNHPL